jgi:hypothetical protein
VAVEAGLEDDEDFFFMVDKYLADFLAENNVKAAIPWLRACDEAGDLGRNFTTYCQERNAQNVRDRESAETMRRSWEQTDQKIAEIAKALDCPVPEAYRAVRAEARNMGMEHKPYASVVLDSVLMNLQREAS